MKKWLIIFLITIITIPLIHGICCEKRKDCIISETCQEANCGECLLNIYNRDGTINISNSNMTSVTSSTYIYNISTNLSVYGTYPYTINCTAGEYCRGDCQVEVKSECGEEGKGNMFAGIGILLLGVTFAFVFFAINSKQEALQIFFSLMALLMVIADFRFSSMIIKSLDPSLTGLIHNMDTMYFIAIVLFRFILTFVIIYMVYYVYKLLKGWKSRKRQIREREWFGFE